jgi:hypothetical protein
MSLPVRIFEPQSQIQKIVQHFQNTEILRRAINEEDPHDQIGLILSFVVSNIYYGISVKKPFNPLLGETMQCFLADGTKFYLEHLSHDPP